MHGEVDVDGDSSMFRTGRRWRCGADRGDDELHAGDEGGDVVVGAGVLRLGLLREKRGWNPPGSIPVAGAARQRTERRRHGRQLSVTGGLLHHQEIQRSVESFRER